jgi:FkbM family methyltransferase
MARRVGRRVINDSSSRQRGFVLSLLDCLPSTLLEKVLFRSSRSSMPLQIAVQHLLAGSFKARVEFTFGPMRGKVFECFSSEKYFLLGSSYECATQALLQEIVKTGDVAYDVGAHAGYTALLLSTLCGRSGHVFAFEPSPFNFARLKGNMESNRIANATLLNLALSDNEGSASLSEMGSYSCLLSKGACRGQNYSEVKTIRLDDFVFRGGNPAPRFLKIDIEGHAGQCLKGAMALLHETRPCVFCEIHHEEEFKGVREVFDLCSYKVTQVDSMRRFPKRFVAIPG